jgi:hypothetical protein
LGQRSRDVGFSRAELPRIDLRDGMLHRGRSGRRCDTGEQQAGKRRRQRMAPTSQG